MEKEYRSEIYRLKRPISRRLSADYSARWEKGARVKVDAWRFDSGTRDGVAYRVVSMWKRPAWLTLSWFEPNFKSRYIK